MSMQLGPNTILAMTLIMGATLPAASAAGDAAKGQQLYGIRCVACHSVESNRVGPAHAGVLGRKAGSLPDYEYSPAVKKSRVIWTDKTLDAWLADPQRFIPGQKMGYAVPQAQDRADLIAYLRTLPLAAKQGTP